MPRLPVPRLPPGGSLGTPNILGTGATFHLGPLRLHVEHLECRAQKWSARCQKCAVPCRFFSACKWGLNVGCIEDSYLQGGMIRECQSNVTDSRCLFERLGCTVHSVTSVLGPVETTVLSGFCAEFCQSNCVPL